MNFEASKPGSGASKMNFEASKTGSGASKLNFEASKTGSGASKSNFEASKTGSDAFEPTSGAARTRPVASIPSPGEQQASAGARSARSCILPSLAVRRVQGSAGPGGSVAASRSRTSSSGPGGNGPLPVSPRFAVWRCPGAASVLDPSVGDPSVGGRTVGGSFLGGPSVGEPSGGKPSVREISRRLRVEVPPGCRGATGRDECPDEPDDEPDRGRVDSRGGHQRSSDRRSSHVSGSFTAVRVDPGGSARRTSGVPDEPKRHGARVVHQASSVDGGCGAAGTSPMVEAVRRRGPRRWIGPDPPDGPDQWKETRLDRNERSTRPGSD